MWNYKLNIVCELRGRKELQQEGEFLGETTTCLNSFVKTSILIGEWIEGFSGCHSPSRYVEVYFYLFRGAITWVVLCVPISSQWEVLTIKSLIEDFTLALQPGHFDITCKHHLRCALLLELLGGKRTRKRILILC